MRHKLIGIAIMGAFCLAGVAHAQQSLGQSPLRFIVTPEVPGPNESVTIEAQGVGTFLGDAMITWQLNGKTVSAGAGQKTFSFTTGSLGAASRVHVTVDSVTQGVMEQDFLFIPTIVNLFWEAQTSVPPFYQGKALYSPGSTVRVIALPQVVANGATIASNNLSFNWSVDGNPVVAQSGQGKSTLTFAGNQLKGSPRVSVGVYLGSTQVGEGAITIPATDPQVLLYVKDPLRGVLYDEALPSSVSLASTEVTLHAEPYYFDTDTLESGAVSYSWALNYTPTSGPDSDRGDLTLRQTGAGAGDGTLSVSLQNSASSKLLQAAQRTLTVLFGQTSNTAGSPFGI